jgi:molybdate transport system regulatory protein
METPKPTLTANGRIWIDAKDGPFLGYGRIDLLEKIKQLGSIRQAALELKMSYRQAWQLVEQMNQRAGEPLIISIRGGKGGGKAILTPLGEQAILTFNDFNHQFQLFLKNYSKRLNK